MLVEINRLDRLEGFNPTGAPIIHTSTGNLLMQLLREANRGLSKIVHFWRSLLKNSLLSRVLFSITICSSGCN
jgi:hypothetical protein